MRALTKIIIPLLLLAGCSDISDIFEPTPTPRLAGKRIAVLERSQNLEPDKPIASEPINLPQVNNDQEWFQAGFNYAHNPQRLSLSASHSLAWSRDIGSGQSDRLPFISQPIVANKIIYAKDSGDTLSAIDLESGDRIWKQQLTPNDDLGTGSFGGGVSYQGGKLYATTGHGEVIALNAKTGDILWRHHLVSPARGAPTPSGNRIIVITVENETVAISADDGHRLWHHNGIAELTSFVGAPSAAVDGNSVIVTYSSGELFALRADSGAVQWTDTLSSIKRTNQVSQLSDIKALPVIDLGRVYAISNADQLVAIDIRTGRRLWSRDIGGIQTPWLAGNFIYLITSAPSLVCIEATTGRIRWNKDIPAFEDVAKNEGAILYSGPILAGNFLLVTTSSGKLIYFSPQTGEIRSERDIGKGVNIAPIISNETLLLVTQNGKLNAYR